MPIRLHLIQLKWFERKGEKVSSVFRVLALVGPSRGSYSFLYACTVFIHNRLKMHSSVQLKLNLISGKCLHFGNAKMTSLCYSNWARNEWVKKKGRGKKYARISGWERQRTRARERPFEREREVKEKGEVAEEQKHLVSEQLQSQPLPKPSGSIFTGWWKLLNRP